MVIYHIADYSPSGEMWPRDKPPAFFMLDLIPSAVHTITVDAEITASILSEIAVARELGKEPAFLFDRISHMRQQDGISLDYQGEGGRAYAERSDTPRGKPRGFCLVH